MSEIINDKKIFSLLEVALSLRKTISARYRSSFWVKAEMNQLNYYSYSGHCYPELVEKMNGKVVALIKATLWKDDFKRINEGFLTTLKEPLRDGINILFNATISFDPVHGVSLRIVDIDPVFSLGELEREKVATIQKLKSEGIFNLNKGLPIPLLPQRIAVISVETSKGYSDFLSVINENSWGYKFFCYLFPALLQGDKSVDSILAQFKRVKRVKEHFDIVAIIRGGGGDVGLSSYNNYNLAKEIAEFPIPVLTGIGHSTNETVAEMVAFKNTITPTELADYLLQKFHNFSVPIRRAEELIIDRSNRILRDERLTFLRTINYFNSVAGNLLFTNKKEVNALGDRLSITSSFLLNRAEDYKDELLRHLHRGFINFTANKRAELLSVEKNVRILDPANVTRRGFTITRNNGKAIRGLKDIAEGDTITTVTSDGVIVSLVVDTKQLD